MEQNGFFPKTYIFTKPKRFGRLFFLKQNVYQAKYLDALSPNAHIEKHGFISNEEFINSYLNVIVFVRSAL